MKKIKAFFLLLPFLVLTIRQSFAQKPREIQIENEPPDLSNIWTIIFLVVIPIVLILGYLFLRKKNK
jgi:hypothetical protein